MPERPIKTIKSNDYVGDYISYIFADGHIETDPPNRPKFKEDVQRSRKVEVARQRAQAILAAERSKYGFNNVVLPDSVVRENANVVTGSVILRPYLEQLRKLSDTADTFTASRGLIESLVTTVPIGGKVVGDNAGKSAEYTEDTVLLPLESPAQLLPYYPTEV